MATVISSAAGRVRPGRFEDFLSQSLEVSKLHERLGAGNPRLFSAGVAGEAFGTWTFSVELPDLESYGAFADRLNADPEMQSLLLRLQQPDNPAIVEQVSLAVEVPFEHPGKGEPGSVSAVNVSKPHPGGLVKAHELAVRAALFVEGHGASRARVFDLLYAGSGAGMMMSVWEYDSMRSLGKSLDAWATDPQGQAIVVESDAGPLTRVFEATYTEIPI